MPEPRIWDVLSDHARSWEGRHLRDLFAEDAQRAARFSVDLDGLHFDYSKHWVTEETLGLLQELARNSGVDQRVTDLFGGERVNVTEGRAAYHMALRNRTSRPMLVNGEDVMVAVDDVLSRMEAFVDRVRSGEWRGCTGEAITDVVNLGIGGSDLGPAVACQALRAYGAGGPRTHFVSNVDGNHLADTLAALDPTRTLFVVASKTFTTQETLTNARSARSWLLAGGASQEDVARHFVAVSTNAEQVEEFGIDPENMFEFWDWVGGRYSLWSAIGLPIALQVGMARFRELLDGACVVDEHFRHATFAHNIPVLMGVLGVWYNNFMGCASHAVLPYDQRLARLPAYLQQLEMESLGKRIALDGRPVTHHTGPVLWGEPGTNGQHAFFQLLHQGTRIVPCDFILPLQPGHDLPGHHDILVANCLAQSEALMRGRTGDEALAEMKSQGVPDQKARTLKAHRTFPGNRPSTTMLLDRVDPHRLGMLIALYEHKVFVQSVIWGINAFDQWGVELGKQLAGAILPELKGQTEDGEHDASTASLIDRYRRARG